MKKFKILFDKYKPLFFFSFLLLILLFLSVKEARAELLITQPEISTSATLTGFNGILQR